MKRHESLKRVVFGAPPLQALLDLADAALERRLMELIRESGVKFRSRAAFQKIGWKSGPEPIIAKFWKRSESSLVPSSDELLWDLRAPLLGDEALACCCVLLWRRSRKYGVPWVGGMETAA